MNKDNLSPEVWKLMLDVARGTIPDGGPLDDDWPDYQDRIAEKIYDRFSDIVDTENIDDLVNELMDEVIRGG